jgi:hypothetical protein
MVKMIIETLFDLLIFADLLALVLILCRTDRNDFYLLFTSELCNKRYFDLLMLLIMCFVMLWLTIPISIYQIIKDKNQTK